MANQCYLAKIANQEGEMNEQFAAVDTIWIYLRDNEQGELYVKDLRGIKIQFNTQTGLVTPVSAEANPWVTSFFSPITFQSYLIPILTAISLLSQQELLNQLAALGDDNIQKIIHQRHTFDADGKMMTNTDQTAVEKTLAQVLYSLKPGNDRMFFRSEKKALTIVQQCVFEILMQIDFYAIKSKNEVTNIINKIKEKIASMQPEDQLLSR